MVSFYLQFFHIAILPYNSVIKAYFIFISSKDFWSQNKVAKGKCSYVYKHNYVIIIIIIGIGNSMLFENYFIILKKSLRLLKEILKIKQFCDNSLKQ